MPNQTIDTVQIEVEATAKGTSAVFSQLERQLSVLKSALNGIDVSQLQSVAKATRNMSIDTSGMSKAEKQVSSSVDKIKQAFAGLQAYKDAAMSGDSSSMTTFERKVIHLQSDIDVLGEKLQQLGDSRVGDSLDTDPFTVFREMLAEVQEALNQTVSDVQNARSEMEQPVDADAEPAVSKLEQLGDSVKSLGGKIMSLTSSAITKGFDNLKKGFEKIRKGAENAHRGVDKLHKGFNRGFMQVLRYGFGIRSLYVLFRRLRKVVVNSFGELQKSGAFFETTRANIEALKSSLSTLGYQFGASFEPIFNAVAPALQTLVNYLIYAMNVFSAFTAKLMGKDTYSKAVASTGKVADNVGGAAKAAKELNKQLQGFDELNNLTSNNPSGGGGGGGASGSDNGVTYVSESVDSVLGDFGKTLAEKIKNGDWEGLGEVISEKLTNAMNNIPWDTIYAKASGFGTGLAEFLNGLISPELFGALGQTIGGAINTALNFLNSFGETFDWTDFGLSIATGINEWFATTDFGLAGDTVHTWVAGVLDAGIALLENTDFEQIGEKLADFLNNLQVADLASKLLEFGKKLIGGIAECIKSLWTNADLQTKIGLALVGMIAVANLTGLSAKLGSSITSFLVSNPITLGKIALAVGEFTLIFDAAKEGFGDWAEYFGDSELADYYKNFSWSDFIETIMKPDGSGVDWETIKEAWCDMMEDYFTPLFDTVAGWIQIGKDIVNNIKKGITEAATGIKDWITTNLVNPIKSAINFGKEFVLNIGVKASEAFEKIKNTIQDWREKGAELKASIKGKAIETIDKIKEKIKKLKDKFGSFKLKASLENGVSKVVDTIRSKIKLISGKSLSLTANIKGNLADKLQKVKDVYDAVKGKALSITATFNDSFSGFIKRAWNGVANAINGALDKINKIPGVNISHIPTFAKGGYSDKAVAGIWAEAGAEAILPLENNLGAINKIAKVMLNGMAKVSKYQGIASPQALGFSGNVATPNQSGISENTNTEQIRRQNQLLEEQNRLLQILVSQPKGITSREVFNAVNSEARNYNARTGNSPFVY